MSTLQFGTLASNHTPSFFRKNFISLAWIWNLIFSDITHDSWPIARKCDKDWFKHIQFFLFGKLPFYNNGVMLRSQHLLALGFLLSLFRHFWCFPSIMNANPRDLNFSICLRTFLLLVKLFFQKMKHIPFGSANLYSGMVTCSSKKFNAILC